MIKESKVIALQKGRECDYIQLDNVTKMIKTWVFRGKEYKVDVYFGTLRDGNSTPVVIMNVYEQGAGTDCVVDDNCDAWENEFTSVTKENGNEYFRYLKKHGFETVR